MTNNIDLSAFGTPLNHATNILAPKKNNSTGIILIFLGVAVVVGFTTAYIINQKNKELAKQIVALKIKEQESKNEKIPLAEVIQD
jgi:hypothetical protein